MRRFLPGERSEAGETLIEVIIATALMGLAVVGIIGGLAATVLGSHVHREQADGSAVLGSAMERTKSTDFDFSNVDCTISAANREKNYETTAGGATLPPNWPPPPAGTSYFHASILFENVSLVGSVPTVSFTGNCVDGLRRQLVTLTLTSPDRRAVPALSFIKGDV